MTESESHREGAGERWDLNLSVISNRAGCREDIFSKKKLKSKIVIRRKVHITQVTFCPPLDGKCALKRHPSFHYLHSLIPQRASELTLAQEAGGTKKRQQSL